MMYPDPMSSKLHLSLSLDTKTLSAAQISGATEVLLFNKLLNQCFGTMSLSFSNPSSDTLTSSFAKPHLLPPTESGDLNRTILTAKKRRPTSSIQSYSENYHGNKFGRTESSDVGSLEKLQTAALLSPMSEKSCVSVSASGTSETQNGNENSEPEVIVLNSHQVQSSKIDSPSYITNKSSSQFDPNSTLERPPSQDMEPFNSFPEISRVVSEEPKVTVNKSHLAVNTSGKVSVKQESLNASQENQSSPNDVGVFLAETYESYLKDIRSDSIPFQPLESSVISPSLPTIDFVSSSLNPTAANLQSTQAPMSSLAGTTKALVPSSGLVSSVHGMQQHSAHMPTGFPGAPGMCSSRKIAELMQTPTTQPGTSQFAPVQTKPPRENWISERLRENVIENDLGISLDEHGGISSTKQYNCNLCSYQAHRPELVRSHLRNYHSNWRPFRCTLCSHSCKIRCNLVSHYRGLHRLSIEDARRLANVTRTNKYSSPHMPRMMITPDDRNGTAAVDQGSRFHSVSAHESLLNSATSSGSVMASSSSDSSFVTNIPSDINLHDTIS